jgi:CheY-like chemotaxis protein
MPQTLLLADDSVTIQRVIELTFADEDITVLAVSDGDQAIARIDSNPPDIVLVDVGMRGRSGYEVARHIKQSAGLKHIPVLLLTGAFEPVDDAKAAEVGCDGVLAKPFEPQLVIARVKELLGRSGSVEAPADVAADGWVLNPGNQAAPTEETRPAPVARLDDYFAQLDEAFSTLGAPPPVERAPEETAPEEVDTASLPLYTAYEVPDAFSHQVQSEPPYQQMPVTPAEFKPSAPAPLPSLADAFAAILAAEQHEPLPLMALWPPSPDASHAEHATPDAALTEQALDDITRRVLAQMSDRVVRDTVAEIAERLVREEIERIKAAIQ